MKAKELMNLGFPQGPVIGMMLHACNEASKVGLKAEEIRDLVKQVFATPSLFKNTTLWGDAATELDCIRNPKAEYEFTKRDYRVWGRDNIEPDAIAQMDRAIELPVAVSGALMPDAHLGYGLPIGGVLALDNAVSPYCVGVDIACRMMLTVLPVKSEWLDKHREDMIQAINDNTCFGVGVGYDNPKQHAVMDESWNITTVTAKTKDKAWRQLGTSGSGNHFVDVGTVTFIRDPYELGFGSYVAILSHSGSRGAGSEIATYYTKLAESLHPHLPPQYKRLAWLSLDKGEGQEYWAAMELMGRYASANHHLIHEGMLKSLGMEAVEQVENHHNFAWKENHGGKQVIVHRKGATPAMENQFGIIPGSMGTPGFWVRGKGNPESLCSASHGAGRAMSRKKTKESFRWNQVNGMLQKQGIEVLSAGLDEVPGGYKNIHTVMSAQTDLVDVVARFDPLIVKMSGDGESED